MERIALFESAPNKIVEGVREGFLNPIDVKIAILEYSKILDYIDRNISEELDNELGKYKGNSFEYGNFKVTKRETKRYDFSNINEWVEKQIVINDTKLKQKDIETKYKSASQDNPVVDITTGEVVTSIPFTVTKSLVIKEVIAK